MSDTTKVLAPNGRVYTFHASRRRSGTRGFVYVHGRRVYGIAGLHGRYGTPVNYFYPVGKWAHLVRAHEYAGAGGNQNVLGEQVSV